ncbi:hypothetical protein GQ53DRAFT_120964 [Thozetella sp. PMI_491]|nr:hypothetical protein GQ53DRAFT_120964 [Thozetella sp. PMI_491]
MTTEGTPPGLTPVRPRRRKPRRGTSSCQECKGRHLRCDLGPGYLAICTPCRRRGSQCVRYGADAEYDEVGRRIEHVESLIHVLLHQRAIGSTNGDTERVAAATARSHNAIAPRVIRPKPILSSSTAVPPHSQSLSHGRQDTKSPSLLVLDPGRGNAVGRLVHSFFPPQDITAMIMHRGNLLSLHLQIFTQPFKRMTQTTGIQSLDEVPQLPPSSAPPIQLAKRLMQLAICLQQMDPDKAATDDLRLGGPARVVAAQYFEIASRYVTSQDVLVDSIEGVETLMMEGLYHVNAGSWRRGWLAFRRALSIGHVLGLDTPSQSAASEANIIATVSPAELIWFRMNYFDRYLSMLACVPSYIGSKTIEEERLTAPDGLCGDLEHCHAVVMGRILARNDRMRQGALQGALNYDHAKETRDIDGELMRISRTMPVRWWAIPTLGPEKSMIQTVRLLMQLHQNNLLLLLHAPYLLEGHSDGGEGDGSRGGDAKTCRSRYHKLAAVNAGREVLSRFIVYQNFTSLPGNCPGTNVKALLAAVALLLAHIDGRRRVCEVVMEHQRPHDLDLVQYAVDTMEFRSERTCDELSGRVLEVLQKLLATESEAAEGTQFVLRSLPRKSVGDVKCAVRETEDGLTLSVPYLGEIFITRQDSVQLRRQVPLFIQ